MRFSHPDVRSNLSLRSKLVLGGILILLIPMTIVGSFTFIKSSRTLEDMSGLQLVQVAKSLSGMVQIALEKDLKNLTTMASDPDVVQGVLSGEYVNIQKKLSDLYLLLSADFEGLAVYGTDGITRAEAVDDSRVGLSIAERDYFAAAKEGKTGVGPMVPSMVTGAPVFGLNAPIMSPDGEFLGGVLGVVRAVYLTKYIAAITLGKTGYVFMVDQEGTIIAHPDETLILTVGLPDLDHLKDLSDTMIRQKTEAVEYTHLGVRTIAGISPVPLTGWSIGVCQEKDEIMALAFSNMNFLLIVSSVFVILIILAVLFFSKTVSASVQTTLAMLNHAIDQAAEAFFIIGRDKNVRFANPAAASIIGRPVTDIVGKPFLHENETPCGPPDIMNTEEEQDLWSGRINGIRRDGAQYTMALTLTPVNNPAGILMYYLAVGRDITEELILHEQLQQSQKMEAIGTLAGGIAHDFNNILSAIFGYTELSIESVENRKELEEYLTEIMEAAKRARDLVSHILTFSRKADLGKKPMIPKYIIKDALKLLRASLPATIEIRESLRSPAAIMGNDTQIHQMTMNLCSNAGYEMQKDGGILDIVLDETDVEDEMHRQYPDLQPGRYLRLTVTDSGDGIPADILERIFDPFFTTKPTGEGTGMGLSVVHGIVKSMRGEIMVNSRVGEGSKFTVLLPIFEAPVSESGGTKRKELPGGMERVLLVDDEKAIVRSMQSLLQGLGYTVRAFNRSGSALEEFMAHPDDFDIVVTDYTMPKMTGDFLARKIRAIRTDVPVILCSGHLAAEDRLDELQPVEFLRKPVTARQLTHAVRNALDRAGAP